MSLSPPPNPKQPPHLQQPASPLTFSQHVGTRGLPLGRPVVAALRAPDCAHRATRLPQSAAASRRLCALALGQLVLGLAGSLGQHRGVGTARRNVCSPGTPLRHAGNAQVWILSQLTATLQNAWSGHVPGELSLSPFDGRYSLVARMLLLLPLAAALALYFERVDPRTCVQEQRILTARDLEPKKPGAMQNTSSSPPQAPVVEPVVRVRPKPTTKAETRERVEQQRESPPPPNRSPLRAIWHHTRTRRRPAVTPRRQMVRKQKAETVEPHPHRQNRLTGTM